MRRAAIPEPAGRLTPARAPLAVLQGHSMGTSWQVTTGAPAPPRLRAEIEDGLAAVVAQMSQWRPDSEINAYNGAPAGAWVAISDDFRAVMACALHVAAATGGAFDPALGGVTSAWGFTPPPPPGAATAAGGAWRDIRLGHDGLLQPGGAQLDLSGIAKGYAVDKTAARLRALGLEAFLVEIGGEMFGQGLKPDGAPWWAQIEAPRDDWREEVLVALPGWAVATSGDYRRHLERDGRRLGHTFDPATGAPLQAPPLSVSVLARGCMWADAWATALTVMGEADGVAFADARDIAALFLVARGEAVEARASAAWTRLWA